MSYISRAKVICSSSVYFRRELEYLGDLFAKNGYPTNFVNNIYKRLRSSSTQSDGGGEAGSDDASTDEDDDTPVALKLPYMGPLSAKFGRRLTSVLEDRFAINVRVVYQNYKIGRYFGLKDITPAPYSSNVVYRFACSEDGAKSYVGVTSRQLFVRVSEHFDPSRPSAVQDHVSRCRPCQNTTYPIDLFGVHRVCRSPKEAEVAEAMEIQRSRPALNKQLGEHRGCSFLLRVFK